MFKWFDEVGYSIDIASLKGKYPELGWFSLEDWAKKQDWSVLGD
jgi:hypothetical protein